MPQIIIWFITLILCFATTGIIAVRAICGLRPRRLLWVLNWGNMLVCCVLGLDALDLFPVTHDFEFVWRLALVMFTAAAILLQLSISAVLFDSRFRRRWAIAVAVVWQLSLSTWTGWRFQEIVFPAKSGILTADCLATMEEVSDYALVTDKGNLVTLYEAKLFENSLSMDEYGDRFKNKLIRHAPFDKQSNCHGWVFTGGHYLLRGAGVETILADNGYHVATNPHPGDLIIYRNGIGQIVHTGVVLFANDDGLTLIESKWGIGGRFIHRPQDQAYSTIFAYYHSDRSNSSDNLTARHQADLVQLKKPKSDNAPTLLAAQHPRKKDAAKN